jgi:hypothetical protein
MNFFTPDSPHKEDTAGMNHNGIDTCFCLSCLSERRSVIERFLGIIDLSPFAH